MLENLHGQAKQAMIRALLDDVAILMSGRWQLDVTISEHHGTMYAYTNCTKFNVSHSTMQKALGNLCDHVEFQKGPCNAPIEQNVNYRLCKLKWQVQDTVTEPTSYGWVGLEQDSTSQRGKRKL